MGLSRRCWQLLNSCCPASIVNFIWSTDDKLLKFYHWSHKDAQNDHAHTLVGIAWLLHLPAISTSKEYLTNSHISLKYFELAFLELQLAKISYTLITIWLHYKRKKKGAFLNETVHVIMLTLYRSYCSPSPELVILQCLKCGYWSLWRYWFTSWHVIIVGKTCVRRSSRRDSLLTRWQSEERSLPCWDRVAWTRSSPASLRPAGSLSWPVLTSWPADPMTWWPRWPAGWLSRQDEDRSQAVDKRGTSWQFRRRAASLMGLTDCYSDEVSVPPTDHKLLGAQPGSSAEPKSFSSRGSHAELLEAKSEFTATF